MKRISGMFPGGPSRPGAASGTPARSTRKDSHDPLRSALLARARRKRRRIVSAMLATLAAAGASGLMLGLEAHPSPASVVESARESGPRDALREETDRVLRELWRMEALERGR